MEGRFPREANLVLAGEPQLMVAPMLPHHRLLSIRLHNAGTQVVAIERSDLRLIDDDGERLPAVPSIRPGGHVAIPPAASLELHFAWRATAQRGEPAELRYGAETLALAPVGTASRY